MENDNSSDSDLPDEYAALIEESLKHQEKTTTPEPQTAPVNRSNFYVGIIFLAFVAATSTYLGLLYLSVDHAFTTKEAESRILKDLELSTLSLREKDALELYLNTTFQLERMSKHRPVPPAKQKQLLESLKASLNNSSPGATLAAGL